MGNRYPFKSAVITGASSGIGRALAIELSGEGIVLGLAGRDESRLAEVAGHCEASGARVVARPLDVASREAVVDLIAEVGRLAPVDLVIANAGVMAVLAPEAIVDTPEQTEAVFETNFTGLRNTVETAIDAMLPRRAGNIALMSSLSAVMPVPHAPAYSASKAAVRAYGDALRPRLSRRGIAVSVIVPGFVDTPLDRSYRSAKPLRLSAEKAARIILRGIARNRACVAFPKALYVVTALAARGPVRLRDWIARRVDGRPHDSER